MTTSSKEVEREVEASRAQVERTVESIRDKLSFGDLVDEASRYFRESGGGEVVNRLGQQVRENPLPLMLVGVGLAWLMSGRGHPSLGHDRDTVYEDGFTARSVPYGDDFDDDGYRYGSPDSLREPRSNVEDDDSDGGMVSDALSGAKERVSSAASALASSAGSAVDGARSGARHAGQRSREALGRAGSASRDAYGRASGYAENAYGRAERTFLDVLDREPLVIGALGLAVGAAIGAALPRTDVEDRYMGDASARAKDEAKDMASEQFAKGKAIAEAAAKEAVDAGRKEAKDQGLSS